jgi:hypothetical protein
MDWGRARPFAARLFGKRSRISVVPSGAASCLPSVARTMTSTRQISSRSCVIAIVLSTPASDCAAALLSPKLRMGAHRIAVNERTGRVGAREPLMSAWGQKQTCGSEVTMSTLPPKADIGGRQFEVRFVPNTDIALSLSNVRQADNRQRRKHLC